MDYTEIDRDMSCHVVTCVRNGTRFYISNNSSQTATDILGNARRYRWENAAEAAARSAREDFGPRWKWMPMSVPQAMCLRTKGA